MNTAITNILRISCALNFFVNAVSVSCCRSQIYGLCHVFKVLAIDQYIVILFYNLVTIYNHIQGCGRETGDYKNNN